MTESDATRREDGSPETRRESLGRSGVWRPGGFARGLPEGLATRFVVVGEFAAAGTEADVVLVDAADGSGRWVLKLYRRGIVPDARAVQLLAGADPNHVVRHRTEVQDPPLLQGARVPTDPRLRRVSETSLNCASP